MTTTPQSQQKPYQQDFIRLASKSVREVFACLHGKRDKFYRTKITIQQMVEWTNKSERSVQKATRWLERHGFFHIQEWRESPYYNAPNVYILETEYRNEEWQDFFHCFFKNMCKFAVFTLMSMSAMDADCTPLLLKELYGIDIELLSKYNKTPTFRTMTDDERRSLNLFIDHHHPPEIEVPFASHQARQADRGLSITATRGTPSTLEQQPINGREAVYEQAITIHPRAALATSGFYQGSD